MTVIVKGDIEHAIKPLERHAFGARAMMIGVVGTMSTCK